jgi:sugar phosphate isomerase/epimerase
MKPYQILPSTTSHKHEPLVPTLEIFARLGMRDLDLNLNHIIDRGASPDEVQRALAANGQRVWIVSGGWCDFFDTEPKIFETFASVERQVSLARLFGVDRMRLFFGRLRVDDYSPRALAICAANIARVAENHPDLLFVLENHDGASSRPEVCRAILEAVDRRNVRLNFDPINFEAAGVDSRRAAARLADLVGHMHLKGFDEHGRFCEFGAGRVDLSPVVRTLIDAGYRGAFTVEYEGPFDRTLRLYQSVRSAESTIAGLTGMSSSLPGTVGSQAPPAASQPPTAGSDRSEGRSRT